MQGPVDTGPGAREPSPPAERRRRLWAQSKDSVWQQSSQKPDQDQDQGPERTAPNGRVPNKISSWLSECRTPIGASLDDHSGSPSRGLRNGCSFEDDLSLGAEANHLQSSSSRSEPGFSLAAEQKRTQFKERAQSMTSTGSGKSSTVSSVSELLDLYEEDPEEILMNLGFGREEPDLASKVPSRFFNSSSSARGIDFKVFLGAQLQRLELENPNYALTSRFRQIEVLTTVANEFFQLYSQVSGQPLHRITPREAGGQGDAKDPPPLKKSASALNAAKLLKRTISRHNLLASTSSSSSISSPDCTQANAQANAQANTQANAQANTQANVQSNTQTNAQGSTPANAQTGIETSMQANVEANTQASTHISLPTSLPSSAHTSPQPSDAEEPPRHKMKMDVTALSTVSEEGSSEGEPDVDSKQRTNQSTEEVEMTNDGVGEVEQTTNSRTDVEQRTNRSTEQIAGHDAGDLDLTTNQRTEEGEQPANRNAEDVEQMTNHKAVEVEKSASVAAADRAVLPQLALLRTENADSFDIEEIHSSEDDVLPQRSSRNADLSRTVSQQSDSSGFAEEPSSDSCSFLKVQESSDSCDSETTVTSHPSQDLATPLATDQPAFTLLTEGTVGGMAGSEGTAGSEGGTEDQEEHEMDAPRDTEVVIPQYSAHQLPKTQRSSPQEQRSPSPTAQAEETIHVSKSEPEEGPLTQKTLEDIPETPGTPFSDATLEDNRSESLDLEMSRPRSLESPDFLSDSSESCLPPAPPSPVLSALNRAKLHQKSPGGRGGRLRCVPLQRSSSLPTTVVSSVRIQLGRGKASHKPPQDEPDSQNAFHGERHYPDAPLSAIPRYLMPSSRSMCSSPLPDWPTGSSSHSWSTQSVPELFTNPQQNLYRHPPPVSYPQPPPPHSYPYVSPYGSLPNLFSPIQPPYPNMPQQSRPELSPHGTPHLSTPWFGGSYTSLNSPPTQASYSPYSGLSHGTPAPSMSRYGSYTHLHHPGPLAHPYLPDAPPPLQPGFHLGPSSSSLFGAATFSPDAPFPHHHHPHHHPVSGSEMQLRRVLQEIRGTLHSLGQSGFGAADVLSERPVGPASPQSVSGLLLKRRSLNAFRSQMMELELSIVREQAQVYRHLSPSDRLEVEQLQRLRSAVREELQELEQQLEERLLELTPPAHMGLQQGSSEDNLSSASALRAMEPVSDLLREQLLLQSELSYHSNTASSASSRCSSPIRRTPTPGAGLYRSSINITPVPPPRPGGESPQTRPPEDQKAGSHTTEDTPTEQGRSQETTATPPVDDLQQLIREIRQSVAQEIRREIYSELLASIAPPKQQQL